MPFHEHGAVRIYYKEVGSGLPLLLIPGGGLNSTISYFAGTPFDAIEEFKGAYRCIAMDLRNATGGDSFGPLEIERPWDAYADDQLGLMDHLAIDKFLVMGFCVGALDVALVEEVRPFRTKAARLRKHSSHYAIGVTFASST
jgi:pimeloyl-ACP methyl ester carboxylesterase